MILLVAMTAALIADGSAKPSPSHVNARYQLPDQASDKAQPPSKPAEIAPPAPVVPLPAPIVPSILVSFTAGQTSSASAEAAIASATQTVRAKVSASPTISVITMTATRLSRQVTRFRPVGRAGDMEILKFRFADRFGRRIGIGNLLCRWANIGRRLCWGDARLPRGTLITIGSSQTRVIGEFAVIGGTGVYLFKQGMLTFSAIGSSKYAVRVVLA
jgi:hypothetical protein